VVGRGEVLEDGETGADSVRAEVRERGEGILLVFEDKAADELGIEFNYHWRGGRRFLGGYGKCTGKGEVGGGGMLGGATIYLEDFFLTSQFPDFLTQPVGGFINNILRGLLLTSGFWPRVRARALCAPVFLGLLPRLTGRCTPLPPIAASLILIYPQNFPSGPNSRRHGRISSIGLSCTLLSYIASYVAMLHPPELRCTLMSYTAPY
jgi:hypothetical protein